MDRKPALILAGGASRRFGRDKLQLTLRGKPILAHLIETLRAADFAPILLANGANTLHQFCVPIVHDRHPLEGPLMAMHDAMLRLAHDRFLVVAGDMPFLTTGVCRLLWEAGQHAAVTHLAGSPLPGLYHRGLVPLMADLLSKGTRRLTDLVAAVRLFPVRTIPAAEWRPCDPEGASLHNINTPEDWDTVHAMP